MLQHQPSQLGVEAGPTELEETLLAPLLQEVLVQGALEHRLPSTRARLVQVAEAAAPLPWWRLREPRLLPQEWEVVLVAA